MPNNNDSHRNDHCDSQKNIYTLDMNYANRNY